MAGFLPGFSDDGGAGAVLAAKAIAEPRNCVILRPGGVASENVYTTWVTAHAAAVGKGCSTIVADDSANGGVAIVLPTGTFDMDGIILSGPPAPINPLLLVEVEIPEGCVFTKLRHIANNIFIRNKATATPPISDIALIDTIVLENGCFINNDSAGVEFIRNTAAAGGFLNLILRDTAEFTGSPAIEHYKATIAGAFTIIRTENAGLLAADSIDIVAGHFFFLQLTTDSLIGRPQTKQLGIEILQLFTRIRWQIKSTTGPVSMFVPDIILADTTSGPFTQVLPTAAGQAGEVVVIKHEKGANILSIDGAGADTIDGDATVVPLPLGGGRVLMRDGGTNWETISEFTAGSVTAHAIGGATHTVSTLAALNALISDATLDDSSDSRPPTAHTHVEADITDLAHTVVLKHKAGSELNAAFSGNPKKATVTFATAFADASYAVTGTVLTTGASFLISIESQVAGSFVLNANANNITGLTQVNWIAIKDGES